MIEDLVKDYATFFKLDVSSGLQTVQDVVDNMITRLEELTSVVNMIRTKTSDCGTSVSSDICRQRHEINTLAKKIAILNDVILQLQSNIDTLEKQVEKAELDFGVNSDSKLKSIFKPFLKKNQPNIIVSSFKKTSFPSVLHAFEEKIEKQE